MDLTPDSAPEFSPESRPPATTYLKDYRPPEFVVDSVALRFDLNSEATRVEATLALRRSSAAAGTALQLDGDGLELEFVELDGQPLAAARYTATADKLIVRDVPDHFTLRVGTRINPAANTALSGLYRSSGNYCTQCEAEGFRRITYFLDRPDVMARYMTTLVADPTECPVLLSNGNLVESGTTEDGRHWARWEDPFPKPSYLFALVAGRLASIEDAFVTASGRRVGLFIYVQAHNIDKCAYAMSSLKRAMRWDEEVYGREYDLDRYMIVAVDDFNMGAMENKGLNVFNSKFVLASPETATDLDYQNIEGVIGHEYFHNWSGNRVTCRDWFQLSLKEGFTVFRDQEFSADMTSRAVKRIQDVNLLRTHQFREDAGPMAHPIRPDSYVEINNFYTATVYNKGAEVVRMLHTLVGPEGFRRGSDLYFERHDGQAVTTEDFIRAIEEANGKDFRQFRRWYSQAGTPVVRVERRFDPQSQTYAMTFRQTTPATPGQAEKDPLHIPIALALLDGQGRELPLRTAREEQAGSGGRVLELRDAEQTFVFHEIAAEPTPSILRGFSAPVRLEVEYTEQELVFLLAHDNDAFCRWEAGQQLARRLILGLAKAWQAQGELVVPPDVIEAFRRVVTGKDLDPALQALVLNPPSEVYLGEFMEVIDPDALHAAREFLRKSLATALREDLLACYHALEPTTGYTADAVSMGRRSLRNLCLGYLMELNDPESLKMALAQIRSSHNMTDVMAAIATLAHHTDDAAQQALADFYERWKDEPLVVDKWLAAQALSAREDCLERVQALTQHPAFTLKNPNKVYALLRNFGQGNPARFHRPDGAGYRFVGDQVARLDSLNPQVAARLANVFNDWRRYDSSRQGHMQGVLLQIRGHAKLSRDVYEIVNKALS